SRKLIFGYLMDVKIQARKKRVVIEHFLEMRHEPFCIDRISVKASAELIVHAALSHLATRFGHDLERFLIMRPMICVEKELERHRGRKFRRATKATVNLVIVFGDVAIGAVENFSR